MKKQLEEEKKALEKKEKSLKKDAKNLIALNTKKKEEEWKENTKGIVSKYESALEHLGRENKRLQTSLKDMVSTNRLLREQNKAIQRDSDNKDIKIEELGFQIKQAC